MEKRENGYSREEFQEFLKKKILKSFFGDRKKRTIKETKNNMLLSCIAGILYIGIAVFLFIWTGTMTTWSFIILFSWIGFFHLLLAYRKIFVYEKLEKFFNLKEVIISENKKFEIIIKNDISLLWIDVTVLWNIKKMISSILEWYKLITRSHKYIQSHMWYFGKIPQEWQDIINTEFQWIINFSQEFTLLVQSWISHHATELAELEKQIQSQELATESEGGKAALELSRISLQEHLKELEKVRM